MLATPEEIRAARKTLGLTQHGLALALLMEGESAWQTISAWENGERKVTGPAWKAIQLMLAARAASLAGKTPAETSETDGDKDA